MKDRQEILDELRTKVYNALSDVMFNVETKNVTVITAEEMQESVEWFMIHFFEDVK